MDSQGSLTVTDLAAGSKCITRNGRYEISEITLEIDTDGEDVTITFVSRHLKRRLNSGAIIGTGDMDRLTKQWLLMRGSKASGNAHELLKRIEDSVAGLRNCL